MIPQFFRKSKGFLKKNQFLRFSAFRAERERRICTIHTRKPPPELHKNRYWRRYVCILFIICIITAKKPAEYAKCIHSGQQAENPASVDIHSVLRAKLLAAEAADAALVTDGIAHSAVPFFAGNGFGGTAARTASAADAALLADDRSRL